MPSDDSAETPRSYSFRVRLSDDVLTFGSDSLAAGDWWLKIHGADGAVVHQSAMSFASVRELFAQSRKAWRLEHYDEQPDFFSVAARIETSLARSGRASPCDRDLVSIYYALGHVMSSEPTEKTAAFLEKMAGLSEEFLGVEHARTTLPPLARLRQGKSTSHVWSSLSREVRESMATLAPAMITALRASADLRHGGVPTLVERLRSHAGDPLREFAKQVLETTLEHGFGEEQLTGSVRARMQQGLHRRDALREEVEERVVKRTADAFSQLRELPEDVALLKAVLLDPDDFASVRSVVRQVFGALMPGERVDSRIRSFVEPSDWARRE